MSSSVQLLVFWGFYSMVGNACMKLTELGRWLQDEGIEWYGSWLNQMYKYSGSFIEGNYMQNILLE